MKRHRPDILALIFGGTYAAVGAGFLINEVTGTDIDPAWVIAITFIALGLLALAVTFTRPQLAHVEVPKPVEATAPAGDDEPTLT